MEDIARWLPPGISDIIYEYAFTFATDDRCITWMPLPSGYHRISATFKHGNITLNGKWRIHIDLSGQHNSTIKNSGGILLVARRTHGAPYAHGTCSLCSRFSPYFECSFTINVQTMRIFICMECIRDPVSFVALERMHVQNLKLVSA